MLNHFTRSSLLGCMLMLAACTDSFGVHQSALVLTGTKHFVVPTSASTKDGEPFSGAAYGTFFGERTMDCVKWSGTFVNGLPEGEFLIYENCGAEPQRFTYRQGARVAPSNSSKPTPLRDAA